MAFSNGLSLVIIAMGLMFIASAVADFSPPLCRYFFYGGGILGILGVFIMLISKK